MGKNPFAQGTVVLAAEQFNLRTMAQHDGLFQRPALSASEAFPHYLSELRAARLAMPDNTIFLAVIDSGDEPNRSLIVRPGDSAILGRHERCDLRLRHCNIALRHLAVHMSQDSTSQQPHLRIWDLHTGTPITTEEGHDVEALASDGPTFLSLGRYHIAAIPLGQLPKDLPKLARDAWHSLPKRTFLTSLAEGSSSRVLPRSLGGPDDITSVTHLQSSVGLEEIAVSAIDPGEAVAILNIQGERKVRTFALGSEHLERGVLIGRYGRCLGRGFDLAVSRVHVLIASVGGTTVAIDTASTVGCHVDGFPMSTRQLGGQTKIRLGKLSHLVWQPRDVGHA